MYSIIPFPIEGSHISWPWAQRIDNLKIDGVWIYASADAQLSIVQVLSRYETALHEAFAPFVGQPGLLFHGGCQPERVGLRASCRMNEIAFVVLESVETLTALEDACYKAMFESQEKEQEKIRRMARY